MPLDDPATQPTGSPASRDNVILIHWHDLGRHLACYGADGVHSPILDGLAVDGIRFTQAHSTAPLCSPARGSLFTGRYPHRNGLVGLAHHGFEYFPEVRTLPTLMGDEGYRTALIGMQHESADPARLGFGTVDVSDSRADYVVERAEEWLRDHTHDGRPFLLTAGFFETHRPYPPDEYEPADTSAITVPRFLPDTPDVRDDLSGLHGSIAKADAAVGRLLGTVADLGLDETTWIVFVTDHGLAFPRAKSTLYAEGTGVALLMRPPTRRNVAPRVYDDLFSGVDLAPTILELLSIGVPIDMDGYSHAAALTAEAGTTDIAAPVREQVFTEKTYHDAYDPIRAVRTKDFSYIENYADRPALLLPLDIADSPSARSLKPSDVQAVRSRAELYDLGSDPLERRNLIDDPAYDEVREALSSALRRWREVTKDDLPSEEQGTAIAERFMKAFHEQSGSTEPDEEALPSRRPLGSRRGLADDLSARWSRRP